MSWRAISVCFVLGVAAAIGCQQQCFLNESDFRHSHGMCLPADLVCCSDLAALPPPGLVPPPMTVDETERPPRYISLREALAIGLENGTVGGQIASAVQIGFASDFLGGFTGAGAVPTDAIRALAIDPAIAANNIELSLSKFDAQWNTSLIWTRTETPSGLGLPAGAPVTPAAFVDGPQNDDLNFRSALVKPLPTGGTAGITFAIDSMWNRPPQAINPLVQPSLQFIFEQPLLQGFGVEINQLRAVHPGSILSPFRIPVGTGEGILITRIFLNEQRAEFERNINVLILNVEAAYWNLYGAYLQLFAREDAMRYAFESWRVTRLLFEGGRVAQQDMEQTRVQYEQFRAQRVTALGQVLESERQLRGLLNLPVEDGHRLVPTDAPVMTPFHPDWKSALEDALARRPELIIARQDLAFRELDLTRQRNNLLPDLRFIASDTLHSLGDQLDGGRVPDNALHNLVADPLNNFQLGLQMNVPIGFRAANAVVRNARLSLQRSYINLRTEEDKAQRFLALPYRQILEFYRLIEINQAALQAATIQIERKFELIRQGKAPAFGSDLILAEQQWATSAENLYTAIVEYNNALATFDFARGAVMERDNVYIADGPLPLCAQVRAVEHQRRQTEALVKIERQMCPAPSPQPPDGAPNLPSVPLDKPLPVPQLMESRRQIKDLTLSATSTNSLPLASTPTAGAGQSP